MAEMVAIEQMASEVYCRAEEAISLTHIDKVGESNSSLLNGSRRIGNR